MREVMAQAFDDFGWVLGRGNASVQRRCGLGRSAFGWRKVSWHVLYDGVNAKVAVRLIWRAVLLKFLKVRAAPVVRVQARPRCDCCWTGGTRHFEESVREWFLQCCSSGQWNLDFKGNQMVIWERVICDLEILQEIDWPRGERVSGHKKAWEGVHEPCANEGLQLRGILDGLPSSGAPQGLPSLPNALQFGRTPLFLVPIQPPVAPLA